MGEVVCALPDLRAVGSALLRPRPVAHCLPSTPPGGRKTEAPGPAPPRRGAYFPPPLTPRGGGLCHPPPLQKEGACAPPAGPGGAPPRGLGRPPMGDAARHSTP